MAKSFWEHPVKTIEEALSIRKQIDALHADLIGLIGGGEIVAPAKTGKPAKGGRRKMSAAARARISAAQKKRWAKKKGVSAAPKPIKRRKRKSGLTAAGRAKLSANMKARWAKRKKGGPAPNPKR